MTVSLPSWVTAMVILPPIGLYLMALLTRLSIASRMRSVSHMVTRLAAPTTVMVCCLLSGERLVGLGDFVDEGRDVDRLAADGDVEGIRHRVRDQVIDHRGQPPGGVADVVDLGGDALARRPASRSARSASRCGRG